MTIFGTSSNVNSKGKGKEVGTCIFSKDGTLTTQAIKNLKEGFLIKFSNAFDKCILIYGK